MSTFIGHGVNGYSAAYPYESVHTSERRLLHAGGPRRGARHAAREKRVETRQLERGPRTTSRWSSRFMQRNGPQAPPRRYPTTPRTRRSPTCARPTTFWRITCGTGFPMLVADMRMHARTLFYQGGLGQLTLGSPAGGRSRPARAFWIPWKLKRPFCGPNLTNPFLLFPPSLSAPPLLGRADPVSRAPRCARGSYLENNG